MRRRRRARQDPPAWMPGRESDECRLCFKIQRAPWPESTVFGQHRGGYYPPDPPSPRRRDKPLSANRSIAVPAITAGHAAETNDGNAVATRSPQPNATNTLPQIKSQISAAVSWRTSPRSRRACENSLPERSGTQRACCEVGGSVPERHPGGRRLGSLEVDLAPAQFFTKRVRRRATHGGEPWLYATST